MTNYEKMKSLGIDEMYKFLDDNFIFSCKPCPYDDECSTLEYSKCCKALKEWLKAESKGGTPYVN